jgi:creatinine amidohydrolase
LVFNAEETGMTKIFAYENLTWPEVADLPRDMPLVIPLGSGYDLDLLAEALGQPRSLGVLPALPYGWRGSGLEVPELILGAYVSNLLASLRDDGFTRVYALTPQALNLGLGSAHFVQPVRSAPGLPLLGDSDRGKLVLVPIGHTEQHGLHLPLSTDTLIIQAIAQATAAAAPEGAVTLPVMPYGVSTHRQAFAGTLNAGGRAFEDFFLAVVDALVARGCDRFYLLSGHGGNCSFLTNVIKYAGERHRRCFVATTWLYLSGPEGVAALEKYRRSNIGGMGHAGELETALILHLQPELVHMDRVEDETDFVTSSNYYMDWVEGGALAANPPWEDDSKTGSYGAGSLGTAEHGKLWLEAAVAEKVVHVAEIHAQHNQREARRKAGYGLWGDEGKPG